MNANKLGIVLFFVFSLFAISASNSAPAATWTVNYSSPVGWIGELAVYNDRLYAAGATGQSDAHLFVYDSNTWSDLNFSSKVGVSVDMIEALQVYNNRLYIGCRVNDNANYYSRVYYYDGTTFTQDFSTNGVSGFSGISDFVIHENNLYAANGAGGIGEVFQRIGDNNWSSVGEIIAPYGDAARSLASYKGSLYVGTGTGEGAKVWRWSGSEWDLNVNITELFGINQDGIQSLASNGDFLYAGTAGSNYPSVIPVYDGTSWTSSINVTGSVFLSVINNHVWAGTGDGNIYWNNGSWQEYGTVNHALDFAEYQGFIYAGSIDGSIYRTESPVGYTISGHITDSESNPVPGVSVSAGAGYSAITDSNGNYTISDVITGTYTVTPSLLGYTFTPSSRMVTVPPDATGIDFVGEQTKIRPIVLLPGMGASANWQCFLFEGTCDDPNAWDWMLTAEGVYENLINDLEQAGYTRANNYLTIFFYDWRIPLSDNVESLRNRIAEVKSLTGADQVDLIGHSMGGLVARTYIQSDTYNYDVAHLITLGSPHMGSALSYPYWEAAYLYRSDIYEYIGLNILLMHWLPYYDYVPVWTLRNIIPSFKDILIVSDYIYNEENGDQVVPEAEMIHRNINLEALNANLDQLFARTDVSTFAGQVGTTPERFYVDPYSWWMGLNWDDGEPNWNRESEFMSTAGDGTVLVSSALLPTPAHTQVFNGVDHGGLPNDSNVIHAIFNTLGIPIPSLDTTPSRNVQSNDSYLIFAMDGNIQTTITDSIGQFVGPGGITIPGAEYISTPTEPFSLVLIPNPIEGQFHINVQDTISETYALSLLDTFNQVPELITDTKSMWDIAQSQIEPGINVSFALTYTLATSTTTSLIAVTPIIKTPICVGSVVVEGRALPGKIVEIWDAESQILLGSGIADSDGKYRIVLSLPLRMGQRIYPFVDGVTGVPVTVQGFQIYVPIINK